MSSSFHSLSWSEQRVGPPSSESKESDKKVIRMKQICELTLGLTSFLLTSNVLTLGDRIESPNFTNFGDFGTWDDCRVGTFVNGMRLKTEEELGPEDEDDKDNDDTALNAVQLFCSKMGSRVSQQNITSSQGRWGIWGQSFVCSGTQKVIGFQVRIEQPLDSDGDNTATNNLRLICEDKSILQGDGLERGQWTEAKYCPRYKFICGLRTQVQDYQGSSRNDDDTSLNQIHAECCNPHATMLQGGRRRRR